MYTYIQKKISRKIILSALMITFLALGLLLIVNTTREKKTIEKSAFTEIRAIAVTSAQILSAKSHKTIENTWTNVDEINRDNLPKIFSDECLKLQRIQELNNLQTPMYTLIINSNHRDVILQNPKKLHKTGTEFILTSAKEPYYRHHYLYKPEMARAFFYQEIVEVSPYVDDHGTWISVYVPLLDNEGNSVAILEVDKHMDELYAENLKNLYANLFWLSLILLITYFSLHIITKRISSDLTMLKKSAIAFGNGNYKSKIESNSRDEVGVLANVLEKSRQQIDDFISRILNTAPVLMMSVDKNGTILPHISKVLDELYPKENIVGKKVTHTVFLDEPSFDDVLLFAFDKNSDIDYTSIMELAPQEVNIAGKSFALIYEPIMENNQLSEIFILGYDITKEKLLQSENDYSVKKNKMFITLIKNNILFNRFCEDSLISIQRAVQLLHTEEKLQKRDIDEIFRIAHTIKGSGASIDLFEIVEKTHSLENELNNCRNEGVINTPDDFINRFKNIESLLNTVRDELVGLIGKEELKIKHVSIDEIERLKNYIEKRENKKALSLLHSFNDVLLWPYLHAKVESIVTQASEISGKDVSFSIDNKIQRVPVTVIKSIDSVLPHIIRNAIDHGLEEKNVRLENDKSVQGNLQIDTKVLGKTFCISVKDDGKGIDPDIVGNAALRKEIISEMELLKLNAQEKIELIMKPGFSTAEEVTELSGRGVGMDAVNEKLAELGGSMSIKSTIGQGTMIELTIPQQ